MDNLPPALFDVVEPLREADEYTRLQMARQRGFYNLVTGAPMFLWVMPPLVLALVMANRFSAGADALSPALTIGIELAKWTLFILVCFPRTFLPLLRRYRPDWQSPLLEADLLKKGLEKTFWLQLPFQLAYSLVVPIALVFGVLDGLTQADPELARDGLDKAQVVLAVVHVVVVTAMIATMVWHARRQNDWMLEWAFLAWLPVALAAPLWPTDQLPFLVASSIFGLALVMPPVLVGLYRLWAPRRWLLR